MGTQPAHGPTPVQPQRLELGASLRGWRFLLTAPKPILDSALGIRHEWQIKGREKFGIKIGNCLQWGLGCTFITTGLRYHFSLDQEFLITL